MLRWPCYIPLHLISCFIRSLLSIFFFVLTARLWIQVFIFSVVTEDALFLISSPCPFYCTHWSQRRLSRTLFSCLCPAQFLFTTFITVWIKCCTNACTWRLRIPVFWSSNFFSNLCFCSLLLGLYLTAFCMNSREEHRHCLNKQVCLSWWLVFLLLDLRDSSRFSLPLIPFGFLLFILKQLRPK